MYNATTLKSVGQCVVQLVNPETRKKCKVKFTVINNDSCTNLLGSKAAQQMGFVDVNYSIMKRTVHVNTVLTAPDEMGVTMKQITSEYKGAFEGLGQLGPMLHLEVDETIKPTQLPSQRIPESIKVPLKARFPLSCELSGRTYDFRTKENATFRYGTVGVENGLKNHLAELEEKGVIEKVQEPTDWVSSIVVARKSNGNIRLCLDPRPLNKALKRCHHLM